MADEKGPGQAATMLASVPLFSGLSKSQVRTLATTAKERSFQAGQTIVKQGEKGIGFYLILSGQARVSKSGTPVGVLSAGQFFGEMALLDEQPRTADVMATGPVRCLVLSPWEFWSAVGDEPAVLRALFKETVRRMRSAPAVLSE